MCVQKEFKKKLFETSAIASKVKNMCLKNRPPIDERTIKVFPHPRPKIKKLKLFFCFIKIEILDVPYIKSIVDSESERYFAVNILKYVQN